MRAVLLIGIVMIGFMFIVGPGVAVGGCSPSVASRVENARVNVNYERELQACIERGKVADSYAVYEACANDVDRRMCVERGVRCMDGGAP